MLKITSVYLLLALVLTNRQFVIAYNVALVQYLYDVNLTSLDLGNRNAKIYDELVRDIKTHHDDLDLVVFPESTLVGNPLDTPDGRKDITFVPKAEDSIVPCNSTSQDFTSFFKLLSCTAQKYRTYLVINLKEKDRLCRNTTYSSSPLQFYNTDVVFDRNGKVIARYRKYHLFLEEDTSRPTKPELITFGTDFGKRFGIFTCFDLLYESPAMDLVRKGVKNFIFPTLWYPELPFLTTLQVQQMWAQGNDVTLLASEASFPKYGSGGLGIFLGKQGVLAKTVLPLTNNYYLYKEVPEKHNFSQACSSEVDDKVAKNMDNFTIFKEDLSGYVYKKLDIDTSRTIEETLCQKEKNTTFCCNFRIEVQVDNTGENTAKYEYFLVGRFGSRTYGIKTYENAVEICGLVACTGETLQTCGHRFSNYEEVTWPVTFKNISIFSKFKDSKKRMQFPNSLLADFSPLMPSCTMWRTEGNEQESTTEITFSTKVPVIKLLSFAIFGRNYDMDII